MSETMRDAEDASMPGLDPYEQVSRDRYNYWIGDAQDIARGNLKSETVRRPDGKIERVSWSLEEHVPMFTQLRPFTSDSVYIVNWPEVNRLFYDAGKC